MGSFKIDINVLKDKPAHLHAQEREITNVAGRVQQCRLDIKDNIQYISINAAINALYAKMLDEASKEKKFADALAHVLRFYDEAEKNVISVSISSNAQNRAESANSADNYNNEGEDKRSGLRKLLDWLFNRQVDTSKTATTKEQEDAADQQMKKQVAKLLDNKRYSEKTWKKASVDERKKILTEYMHDVEKILGIKVSDNINWTYTKVKEDGTLNMGAYSHGSKTVNINAYVLEDPEGWDSYHLMTTIAHELRHAYQHQAVDHPDQFQVSKETIDSWRRSFDTYNEEQAKGFEAYRNIVVEKDARWFAGQS